MSTPLLQMRGISKSFGATQALRDVSLEVRAGEVMALIGENGAGKSTLMKVLSGAHPPDAGTMELAGQPYAPRGPHAGRLAGVAMIYQELTLAPDLSVEDNIMLGQEESSWGWLRRDRQRQRVRQALALLGHGDLRPETPVQRLSVGAQQLVEIARALVHDAKVIVFDEPTSSLTAHDVEHLFQVIRKLRASGLGIVYISHFLEEVRAVGDRYTVLRDGQSVGTAELKEISEAQIVSLMVGRSVDELFPRVPHAPGDVILSLDGLCGERIPRDVSLELRRGEILGIAGLVGAGRTELLRTLFGLEAVRSGQVRIAGLRREHVLHRASPREMIAAGVGFVSEDRKGEGLAQNLSIDDNVTYSRLGPYRVFGWLRPRPPPARRARLDAAAQNPRRLAGAGGAVAVRRQPAEGGPRPRAAPGGRHPALGRADARHRRGHEGRDLSLDRPGRRRGQGDHLRQLLLAGAVGGLRPHRRDVARSAARSAPGGGVDGGGGDELRDRERGGMKGLTLELPSGCRSSNSLAHVGCNERVLVWSIACGRVHVPEEDAIR